MASSYTDLGIEKMATGENAGTWGTKTNTNLDIIEKSIAGYVEQAVTSGGTTALTITDGDATESTSVARHAVIKLTGTITGNSIVTVPDSVEKVYIVTNGTSGAYTVQFKTASGTGITFGVSEKTTRLVYSDGTNLVDAGFGGATDMEGRELVLDADGDTTITADTDDQIDIKIAGADDFQFTANTFTAQSGSTIAAQALTATTIVASSTVQGTTITATTAFVPDASDGAALGTSSLEFSDLFLADGAVINFGDDQDVSLTHVADTGLLLSSGDQLQFGDAGENISGDGTDLTISGNNINLTATADVNIPSGVGLTFATAEKIESDGTDLSITVGSNGDINIGSDIGLTFGDDGEKIEGNGTDLTIASSNDLHLTATTDINVPANVGVTFGDDGEKIEGDGTNLTITSSNEVAFDLGTSPTIALKQSGTQFGHLKRVSNNLDILSSISDGDITFRGSDGGSTITALTLDMSAAGAATFNDKIVATELDISGNVDIDGTLETDALSIASTTITTTAAEINLIDGGTARGTTAVADGDGLLVNDAGTMRMTNVTTLKTYFQTGISSAADDISAGDAAVSITTSSGDITIDAAANDSDIIFKGTDNSADITMLTLDGSEAGAASFNGVVTANAGVVVDNITIDGTEIDLSSGDLTVDVAGDITLDAGGADINFADDGTTFGSFTNHSSNLKIKSTVQDKDIIFMGDDSGTEIVALTLDMSSGGTASFLKDIQMGDGRFIGSQSGGTAMQIAASGAVTFSQAPVFPDGSIAVADLDIDGATDIGADLVDADLFIVDDGAGGTNRKVAASRLKTYIGGGTSWQAVKTGNFTASAGQGVFVNTTSAAITITLPAGTIGDEVSIVDYAGTFDSNACTVAANGSEKIFGSTDDLTVSTERAAFTLVFTDSTQGWLFKND
jgi:hypothetical protein